jgi:ubiquinone/menaquinone biosynthesis C-methylase UbiE
MNDTKDVVKTTRHTYDQIASQYSARIDKLVTDSWVGRFEHGLLDEFRRMIKRPQPHVLDIGCGNGKDTAYLKQKGARTVGIDYSLNMLTVAKHRLKEGILCQMDLRCLAFGPEVFDGVWANGCIYHIPKSDLTEALKEFVRVLKPYGSLSFNFKAGVGERLEESPRSFQKGARFYAYYTIAEMEDNLKEAGLNVMGVRLYPKRIFDEEIAHIWAQKI